MTQDDLKATFFEGRTLMADIEKVIKGLEKLCKSSNAPFVCFDALELLKKQNDWLKRIADFQLKYASQPDVLLGLQLAQDIINGEI